MRKVVKPNGLTTNYNNKCPIPDDKKRLDNFSICCYNFNKDNNRYAKEAFVLKSTKIKQLNNTIIGLVLLAPLVERCTAKPYIEQKTSRKEDRSAEC